MGDIVSTQKDTGKQIGGILAAEYKANHPNYLAIVNVDKSGHKAWDELKAFMLKDGWKPAYDKAKHCKYYLKRYDQNPAEFIESIYQKLGKFHDILKAKHGANLSMEYVVLKVCLPGAASDFMIPNMKEIFENADKQAAAVELENTANPNGKN